MTTYQIPAWLVNRFLSNLMAQEVFPFLRMTIEPVIPFPQQMQRGADSVIRLTAVGGGRHEDLLLRLVTKGGALHHWWASYELLPEDGGDEVILNKTLLVV